MFKKLSFLLVIVMFLSVTGSALAITWGELDGNRHPGVGAVIYWNPAAGFHRVVCSGALISPTVFLTAAHCNLNAFFGTEDVYVSFDTDLSLAARQAGNYTAYHGTFISDPRYSQRQNDNHDIAVIVLDAPVTGRPIYQLPTLGQFDNLRVGAQFTAVGYGQQEPVQVQGAGVVNAFTGYREYAVSSLNAVNRAWLRLSQNAATGDAGTCYGDSGGPNFLGAGAGETPIIAAVTITGDYVCRATNVVYRLDSVSARQFLGQFVNLP